MIITLLEILVNILRVLCILLILLPVPVFLILKIVFQAVSWRDFDAQFCMCMEIVFPWYVQQTHHDLLRNSEEFNFS